MSDQPLGANPYVGPRPFRMGEPLFGRATEIRDLYYLLNAQRIVLLHSPSGAGKSSMVQAGLIPKLQQEKFDVWPATRVNLEPPSGVAANRYALSTILSLEEELPEKLRRTTQELSALTLEQYVATRPRKRGAAHSVVLIFDQFEEILTVDPLAIEAKRQFFTQLGDLLGHREFWALFVIREDYLAPLDPYARLIPTQLKNRFRLDLLGLEAAMEAISEPARQAGREFAPGVAEHLVRDLAAVSVQQDDGTFVAQSGHSVEPVQLQVVGWRLWDEMPEDDRTIDEVDMQRFGDVTQALGAYYDLSIFAVAGGVQPRERAIREWFSEKLITRGEIRGQVLQGANQTEGLDNRVIRELLNTHLIRAEKRRGATWFELAHDRLIQPVMRSNTKWFETHLEEVQRRASLWEKNGNPEGLLLLGGDLRKADDWLKQHDAALTSIEDKFLKASHRHQADVDADARQAKRIRLLAMVASVVGVVALIVAGVAWSQRQALAAAAEEQQRQELAKQAALEGKTKAERNTILADAQRKAESQRRTQAEQQATTQRKARDQIFLDLLTKVIKFPIAIDKAAVPGEVKPGDPSLWTTLVAAKDQTPFMIARSLADQGQGRVVLVGHDGFLAFRRTDDPIQELQLQSLGTVLLWLRGDRERRVLIGSGPTTTMTGPLAMALANRIRGFQFEADVIPGVIDRAMLDKAGVLLLPNHWGGLSQQEIADIVQFVNNGGGVLGAGLGWSWRQPRPGAPTREMAEYPMNQLFSHFGASWTEKVIWQ